MRCRIVYSGHSDLELLQDMACPALIQFTAIRIVHKYNMPTNRSVYVEPHRAEQEERQEDRIVLLHSAAFSGGLAVITAF